MFQELNLPTYDYKVRQFEDGQKIFDPCRKKYVALTPEEWVRQHFINYLHVHKKYPLSLLAVEYPLMVNDMQQRADIVAFGREGKPIVVVECKATAIELSQTVIEQVARYNIILRAKILIITNGINHYCWKIEFDKKKFVMQKSIPNFSELSV